MSMKLKMIFIVSATTALILIVIGLGMRSLDETRSAIKNEYGRRQLLLAQGVALGIEQYLDTVVHEIRGIADFSQIRDFDDEEAQNLVTAAYDDLEDEGINDIGVLDKDGILRYGVKAPFLIGADFSFRQYFQDAKKAAGSPAYFIEFIEFKGADLGKKGALIAVPITEKRPSTEFKGVFLVTLPLDYLSRTFIEPLGNSNDQQVFLIDRTRSILWSSDKSLVGRDIVNDAGAFPAFASLVRNMRKEKQGATQVRYSSFDAKTARFDKNDADNNLIAYTPIGFGDNEWSLILLSSEERVLSLANSSVSLLSMFVGSIVLIVLIAATAASAWVVRSTNRLKKRQERDHALNEIGREINSTLEAEQIVNLVVKSANDAMGCDSTSIGLVEDNIMVIRYAHGLMKPLIPIRLDADQARAGFRVFRTGEPLVINDTSKDTGATAVTADEFSVRSFLGVPLTVKGKPLGVLAFHHNKKPVAFSAEDLEFAQQVGATVSLSLENANLYESERDISSTLQKALLDMPESIPNLNFGHVYKASAIDDAQVGGDFYDLFDLGDGKTGILIGDVSGKGIQAASVTALTKNTIKAYAQEFDSPSTVLSKTNQLLLKHLDPAIFVTTWFGSLCLSDGNLTFSNAGHPPPSVKTPSGHRSIELGGSALPLGVLSDAKFHEERDLLQPGDTLILLTDGAIEARKGDSFFGENNFADVVDKLDPAIAPDRIPSAILDKIITDHEYNLVDDVAILAISLTPSSEKTCVTH